MTKIEMEILYVTLIETMFQILICDMQHGNELCMGIDFISLMQGLAIFSVKAQC